MAWTDKPTEAQLERLYQWLKWEMPTSKARDALDWLGQNADRRQVSDEMQRIRELKVARRLNHEECFASKIWESYPFREADCNWVPEDK